MDPGTWVNPIYLRAGPFEGLLRQRGLQSQSISKSISHTRNL